MKNSLLLSVVFCFLLISCSTPKTMYDHQAKTIYSENDVKSFVYQWFASLDHQKNVKTFIKHLPTDGVDMLFPEFPIKSRNDFKTWYKNVGETIRWNSHDISHLNVSGNETTGFKIGLDIHWKAITYKNENYDLNIHQDWKVNVDKKRNFIIAKHRATLIDPSITKQEK